MTPMDQAGTHVWQGAAASAQADRDHDRVGLLSPGELDRASLLAPDTARLYLASHVATRRILAGYLDRDPAELQLGRRVCPQCADPLHGAPAVSWPRTTLSFNLTASGGSWLLAVTHGQPLGVDLAIASGTDPERAAPLALTAQELDRLHRLTDPQLRRALFLRAWTRKEAVVKAVGVGLVTDLRQIEVAPERPGPVRVRFGVGSSPREWTVQDLPLGPGRFAAVARPAPAAGRVQLCEYSDQALYALAPLSSQAAIAA
ncbi:4'-phosphopantetheinyl transferase superfamily protein [Kitasatospora sp. MAA4]|uniref:4'-phosphopantetheinyl transferase family protein n=1 Tax=Kitasatospora sp. MAA4 TaxID=3035093 RepID=UPI0024759E1A|nr:4'-phosphopantetheinyl transferase superfamily protein [Kitasatospora sp. MAA4]